MGCCVPQRHCIYFPCSFYLSFHYNWSWKKVMLDFPLCSYFPVMKVLGVRWLKERQEAVVHTSGSRLSKGGRGEQRREGITKSVLRIQWEAFCIIKWELLQQYYIYKSFLAFRTAAIYKNAQKQIRELSWSLICLSRLFLGRYTFLKVTGNSILQWQMKIMLNKL